MLALNKLLQNRYLIERSIGQGGMGTVYVGVDQQLGNRVALKGSNLTEEGLPQAFEREARLLAHSRASRRLQRAHYYQQAGLNHRRRANGRNCCAEHGRKLYRNANPPPSFED